MHLQQSKSMYDHLLAAAYSLHSEKKVVLACERCPSKNVVVAYVLLFYRSPRQHAYYLHSLRWWTTAFGVVKYKCMIENSRGILDFSHWSWYMY